MNQLSQILTSHTEWVLFFAILVEQLGLPLPSAPLLVAAGTLSAGGNGFPAGAMGVTVAACLLADLMWYYVGRRGGNGVLRRLCSLFMAESSWVERAERLFARYGMAAILAAKFLPGLSLVIPPLAGAFRIEARRFLSFDGLGSLFYAVFYLGLGFLFSDEVTGLLDFFDQLGVGTALLACLVTAIFTGFVCWKRRKTSERKREPITKSVHMVAGA